MKRSAMNTELRVAWYCYRVTMKSPSREMRLRRAEKRGSVWIFDGDKMRGEITVNDVKKQIATLKLYYGISNTPWVERKMTLREYYDCDKEDIEIRAFGAVPYHKRRYEILKARGICTECGKVKPKDNFYVCCDACRARAVERNRRFRRRERERG